MRAGSIILIAGLVMGASAAAQPAREASAPSVMAGQESVPIVLASAGYTAVHASDAGAPAKPDAALVAVPAKRRIARVTTCRCGDPQAVAEVAEQ